LTCKPAFNFRTSSVKRKKSYVQGVDVFATLLREISILILVALAVSLAIHAPRRERLVLTPAALAAIAALAQ